MSGVRARSALSGEARDNPMSGSRGLPAGSTSQYPSETNLKPMARAKPRAASGDKAHLAFKQTPKLSVKAWGRTGKGGGAGKPSGSTGVIR